MQTVNSLLLFRNPCQPSVFSETTLRSSEESERVEPSPQAYVSDFESCKSEKFSFSQILEQVAQPASTSPAVESRLIVGSMIGRHRIEEFLGAGGMGWIFKARDTLTGAQVAIKMLPTDKRHDASLKKLLINEASCASLADHPHVISAISLEEHADAPVMVMELLEGPTLRSAMNDQEFSEEQALKIAEQIASGLAAIHSAGVVHRDLKPENIMLTSAESVKIIDFGIAWNWGAENNRELLGQKSEIAGTPRYMAPEQRTGAGVDPRSDIYAFGAILVEMLTGHPFSDRDSISHAEFDCGFAKTVPSKPGLVSLCTRKQTTEKFTDGLRSILSKCLAQEPKKRFSNGTELHQAIQELLASSSSTKQSRFQSTY